MKDDLTIHLIFFRPVMILKCTNSYKAVFNFKQMGLFLICQGMWAFGVLSYMIRWDIEYWFSTPGHFFVGFCFFVGVEKCFNLVQSIRIKYRLGRKMLKWSLMRDWTGLKTTGSTTLNPLLNRNYDKILKLFLTAF